MFVFIEKPRHRGQFIILKFCEKVYVYESVAKRLRNPSKLVIECKGIGVNLGMMLIRHSACVINDRIRAKGDKAGERARGCSQPEIKTCAAETIHSSLFPFAPVAQSLEKERGGKNFTTLSLIQ